MNTPLFDVLISVDGDDEHAGVYGVRILDRYHRTPEKYLKMVAETSEMHSLDEAMEFVKGAVTAFMLRTDM